jgi:PAS domain S-box-containing protein
MGVLDGRRAGIGVSMDMKFKPNLFLAAMVFLLGATLSLVVFIESRNSARDRFFFFFQQQAKDRISAVSAKFDLHRHELESFRRFYEHSEELNDQKFEQYTQPMLLDSCIQSMEWIPRVRKDGRAAFEVRAGIQIREQDADGALIPARERAEYFPVELAEPFKFNEAALGFDLASNPERRAAMEAARDQGTSRAMELVRLVQRPADPAVFMVVAPVYRRPSETLEDRRRNLRGFVLGMYRLEELVIHAMEQVSVQGLAFVLEDLDAAPGNRLLCRHEPRIGTFDWDRAPDDLWEHEELIDGVGRNWRMTVLPNDAFIQSHLSLAYWWILPVGLLLSLLAALLLHMQMQGRLRAELLVQERTATLRASEGRLQSVFRAAPTGIGVVVDRVLSEVNERMCAMTGYSAEELNSQPALMLYASDDEYEFVGREKYEQIRDHGTGTVETRWKRKDGHVIDVLLSSTPMDLDDLAKGVTFTALDISERKRAERTLVLQTEILNDTQHLTKVGGWQWDLARMTMTWTDELYRIHGFSQDDFEPGSMEHMERSLECYNPKDRPVIMAAFERCAADGQPYDLEFPFTAADGCRKQIRTTGQAVRENDCVVRVFGNVSDITELKRAEEALRDSEERFRRLAENAPDMIYRMSLPDGIYE